LTPLPNFSLLKWRYPWGCSFSGILRPPRTVKHYSKYPPHSQISSNLTPTNSLDILSWNAHSLNSPLKKLFIASKTEPIKCIQETWGASVDSTVNGAILNSKTRLVGTGGGSLTILDNVIRSHKEFLVNQDSKLLRLILHGNKVLWLCNCYLSLGNVPQIQSLFKTLRDTIPKDEWDRVIVIGDFNINLQSPSDGKVKLLKTLAKELGLQLIEPPSDTFGTSKLDYALVSNTLNASLSVIDNSLSDHKPIVLKVEVKILNKQKYRVRIPNRKLAEEISISTLYRSLNATSWIRQHHLLFKCHEHRAMKSLKKIDYERKLFEKLTENKNVAIMDTIKQYWHDIFEDNEKLRFSSDTSGSQATIKYL